MTFLTNAPGNVPCEVRGAFGTCQSRATHIYGPECEAETGKLMYLCEAHAQAIDAWVTANPHQPVECPTHGRIGKVKDYVILRRM